MKVKILLIVLTCFFLLSGSRDSQVQAASEPFSLLSLAASGELATCNPEVSTIRSDSSFAWAFEETFDGDPSAPSQDLLPQTFDYVVTHRTHPTEHFQEFESYPADHGMDCAGPDPSISPLPQHSVVSSHYSTGTNPDASFFICKNHLMSSMGEISGYSVTTFWPKQEFDFSAGGVLEFEVNINDAHPRTWWEVLIAPRDEIKVGAAHEWLPIDETYPKDRIVFDFQGSKRHVQVGANEKDPAGKMAEKDEVVKWAGRYPDDPANTDRRIRRTVRITFEQNRLIWAIEKADETFDEYVVDVPQGLPFTRGLVLFKTHAYTPEKENNYDNYTFHWDNIRFTGPVVGLYENFETEEVVYMQGNGSKAIGLSETVSIDVPHVGAVPRLFGQVHNPMRGQVLLSINGGPNFEVHPYDYDENDCYSDGWKSFLLPLDASSLKPGTNTFTWTIGPRPGCAPDWLWDGYSIKGLEIQYNLSEPSNPTPTAVPATPTPSKTPSPDKTPVPSPTPGTSTTPDPSGTPVNTRLSGRVFVDENGNGVYDEGEPTPAGVIAILIDLSTNGQVTTITTQTDTNGVYQFVNVEPDEYVISFALPPGYIAAGETDVAVNLSAASQVQAPDYGLIKSANTVYLPILAH